MPFQHYKDTNDYWTEQIKETRERTAQWNGNCLSMFARATVCNIFLMSKLWYVMQVLCCSRVHVQKLHRIFAVFIWGSTWEKCSRTILFRRVKQGGLSLSHLFVRQLVNRFIFFRDVQHPFLRTVCQLRLCRVLPNFVVSTASMPGATRGFFKEVLVGSCQFGFQMNTFFRSGERNCIKT